MRHWNKGWSGSINALYTYVYLLTHQSKLKLNCLWHFGFQNLKITNSPGFLHQPYCHTETILVPLHTTTFATASSSLYLSVSPQPATSLQGPKQKSSGIVKRRNPPPNFQEPHTKQGISPENSYWKNENQQFTIKIFTLESELEASCLNSCDKRENGAGWGRKSREKEKTLCCSSLVSPN